ncbi:hypothetical protein [Streptomyces sp. NRRL S-237]|nr:hypothetical protein [Streptomyces sp. NRRL S-237]
MTEAGEQERARCDVIEPLRLDQDVLVAGVAGHIVFSARPRHRPLP